MTVSPVKPADAKAIIFSSTSDFCLGMIRWMLQGPALFYKLINYVFNADGTVNNLFLQQVIPPGMKMESFSSDAPDGYLLCNGAVKNRTDYPDLFTAIGTIYGDGNSDDLTFNLPDCQGRCTIGAGTTQGLKDLADADLAGSTYALGVSGGDEKVQLITAEMPAHRHQQFVSGEENTSRSLTASEAVFERGAFGSEPSYNMTREDDADTTQPAVGPTSIVGGDSLLANIGKCTSHKNMPPYVVTYFYIKT